MSVSNYLSSRKKSNKLSSFFNKGLSFVSNQQTPSFQFARRYSESNRRISANEIKQDVFQG